MDDSDSLAFGSGQSSPEERPPRWTRLQRRPWTDSLAVRLGIATALVACGLAWFATSNPDWPTHCGVAGHPEWCAAASSEMRGPLMAELVQDYCPGLSEAVPAAVSPQPLSRLGLADGGSFALTTGAVDEGTEDALLGSPGDFAWVTRWVGGPRDGLVQVRCHGDTGDVSDLALPRAQYESTIAALHDSEGRHIDFGEVARLITASVAKQRPRASFGFLSCDTTNVDLDKPRLGAVFSCLTEVYAAEGMSAYRSTYTVTASDPYFEQDLGESPQPDPERPTSFLALATRHRGSA